MSLLGSKLGIDPDKVMKSLREYSDLSTLKIIESETTVESDSIKSSTTLKVVDATSSTYSTSIV